MSHTHSHTHVNKPGVATRFRLPQTSQGFHHVHILQEYTKTEWKVYTQIDTDIALRLPSPAYHTIEAIWQASLFHGMEQNYTLGLELGFGLAEKYSYM